MGYVNRINPKDYDFTVNRLREFFRNKGFIEVPVQHQLSILAACEDPRTMATFNYAGKLWPLPQTGQMCLEYELLTRPEEAGYYCISTSFRNEPHPVPGRHDLIFPMFEFETHGDINTLKRLEIELLDFMGFGLGGIGNTVTYDFAALKFGVAELTGKHEELLWHERGPVVFLVKFPESTSPFWNMKRSDVPGYAQKIDVILYGIETIGSAERSTDHNEMRHRFHTISNGMYADILYAQFGEARVRAELEKFLSLPMIPRCGGGIGITRMIRALKMAEILK